MAVPSLATALQFGRFLATGVLNTAVGLSIIGICWHVLGLSEVASNAIGYGVGLCVSFWLNRHWTFRSRRSMRSAVPRFFGVFVVAYLANLATLLVLLRVVDVRMEFATVLATVPYTIVFYLGSRWFVFPARDADERLDTAPAERPS